MRDGHMIHINFFLKLNRETFMNNKEKNNNNYIIEKKIFIIIQSLKDFDNWIAFKFTIKLFKGYII